MHSLDVNKHIYDNDASDTEISLDISIRRKLYAEMFAFTLRTSELIAICLETKSRGFVNHTATCCTSFCTADTGPHLSVSIVIVNGSDSQRVAWYFFSVVWSDGGAGRVLFRVITK